MLLLLKAYTHKAQMSRALCYAVGLMIHSDHGPHRPHFAIATSNAAVTTRMQVSTSVLCGNMKSLHHGRIRADVPHARQDLPCLKSVICD
ncbi:MAG: hypothetical protein BGP23_13305 [Lysobacterales bacterium 66-474]|nr:MAG: hypothetical protein BGP23_13305 [Xanthomonadales bacterium 66-474]